MGAQQRYGCGCLPKLVCACYRYVAAYWCTLLLQTTVLYVRAFAGRVVCGLMANDKAIIIIIERPICVLYGHVGRLMRIWPSRRSWGGGRADKRGGAVLGPRNEGS